MNTQEISNFEVLTIDSLEHIEGGVPYGWYSPFASVSNNIICRNGHPFTFENYRKGICAVDWSNVAGNVANNIGASFGDLHNPLP